MFLFKKNKLSILSIKLQLKYDFFKVYNPIYMQIRQLYFLSLFCFVFVKQEHEIMQKNSKENKLSQNKTRIQSILKIDFCAYFRILFLLSVIQMKELEKR